MFIAALFTIAKIGKQSVCKQMNKENVYINMEYYSTMRKKEILTFVTTWMDLEGIMLSEIRKRKKNKYYMISLICGI